MKSVGSKNSKLLSNKLEEDYKKLEEEFKFIEEFNKGNQSKLPQSNRPISLQEIKKKPLNSNNNNINSNNSNNPAEFNKEKINKQHEKYIEKQKLKEIEKLEAKLFKQTKRLVINDNNSLKKKPSNIPIDLISKISNISYNTKKDDFDDKLSIKQSLLNKTKKELKQADMMLNESEKQIFGVNNNQHNNSKYINTNSNYNNANVNVNLNKVPSYIVNSLEEEQKEIEFLNSLKQNKRKEYLFKFRDVYDFLKDIKLARYIDIFLEDGFDELNCLLEMTDEYLMEKGFNDEKRERIINKISKFNNNNNGKLTKDDDSHSHKIDVDSNIKDRNNIQNTEIDTQTIPQELNLLPANKEKVNCWNCLKMILKENCKEKYYNLSLLKQKYFCSDGCLEAFETNIYSKCEVCKSKFEITSGYIISENKYICSSDICYIKAENLNMFEDKYSDEKNNKSDNNRNSNEDYIEQDSLEEDNSKLDSYDEEEYDICADLNL